MASQKLILNSPIKKDELKKLPTTAGVYIFRYKKEILYIGKSVNIKARVLSHWENAKIDAKEASIIGGADRVECIVADSEFNALLLESRLIQQYKPKFNSRWRDDRSDLYIKITIADEYPKVFPTRKEMKEGVRYFGPFQSVHAVETILKEIRRIFPYCSQSRIGRHPCFYSKLHLCNPCPSAIEQMKDETLKKELKEKYNKNIKNIIKILEGKTGPLLNGFYSELKRLARKQKYEEAMIIRNRIMYFENLLHRRLYSPDAIPNHNLSTESLTSLKELLGKFFNDIKNLNRIECIDVSSFSQKKATASLVVFTDGLSDKKEYRRFKIKDHNLRSDFEMMNEVLERRFKRDWKLPDLLVVDGGKPQVRITLQNLREKENNIPVIGIAKHPDRLVIGNKDFTMVRPSMHHLGFNLVRKIRDESHRFAKKYHVLLRKKGMFV